MFSNAFTNPSKAKWIIQGAGIIWLLGSFLLLRFYQVDYNIAWTDAVIFTVIFLIGIFVLERIFGFYIPKGGNTLLLLVLPLLLSLVSVYVHRYLLQWIFENELGYIDFLKDHVFLRWAFLAIAEIFVALIAIVVSKLEQQEETRKREMMMNELSREAELTQLRQQLQPHFLFNSLNSINALVVSQPKKAREMVLQLSEFLRGTIRKDHQQWLSLEEELNYLKMYLEIERVRFGHRLEVEFDLADDTKALLLPQLLIQPLLENAIKHGLYGITGEVKITVQTRKESTNLLLKITNPFDMEASSPPGTGFGLSSIERRLFLLFGRKDLLETKFENHTFSVELKIPQLK